MTEPIRARSDHWRAIGAILLLIIAAILPYRGAGQNGFVYDDILIVQDNARVQDLHHIGEIFRTEYWNDPNLPSRLYRPATLLTYAVERTIFGPSPGHFHLVNVKLHVLASLLVLGATLLLLRRREGGEAAALLTALLFAVHPLHSEAVAGIVGRAELLATIFVLMALAALHRGGRWRWVAPIAALAGLLSKESALVIVPLAALIAMRDERPRLPRAARNLLWIAPALLVWWLLRASALNGIPAPKISASDNPIAGAPLAEHLATASAVFARYVGLHLWPAHLSPDYSPNAVRLVGLGDPMALLGLALVIAFAVVALRGLRRDARDPIAFGLAWWLSGMLVVGNFVVVIGTAMAERLTYLPGIGLFLAGAELLRRVIAGAPAWRRAIVIAGVSALALVSVVATSARTAAWRSPRTLFEQASIDQPQSFRVWAVLGELQMKEGQLTEARASLAKAHALFPSDGRTTANLLAAELTLGNDAAAIEQARALAAAQPNDARPHAILALLHARQASWEEARREVDTGLALDASSRPLHYVAAKIARESGGEVEVAAADSIDALRQLGPLFVRLALWPEAVDVYRGLHRTQKDWATANALAWSLVNRARAGGVEKERDLAEARAAAEEALASVPAPSRKYVLDTLAAAEWESGDRARAIQTLERLQAEFPWEDGYRRKLESFRAWFAAP